MVVQTMVRCMGCGGLVPDVDGPTHRYMPSAPGCWQAYGEVQVRAMSAPQGSALRHVHVDCFAAQHPTNAAVDRKQRQSVAVHLVALCLHIEHGVGAVELNRRRQKVTDATLRAAGLEGPLLDPPDRLGDVTAISLREVEDLDVFADLGEQWPLSVWDAWAGHHERVREFALLALAQR